MSEKEIKTVLPSYLSAGPHGLGDPDDKRLRTSERKVLIPQLIRKRSREVKCLAEVRAFEKCAKDNGLLVTFKCGDVTDKLKDCMAHWFYNEDFNKECTQIYLDERSEYRRTGISKKHKEQMAAEQQEQHNT
ncbi:COX assembly mitochondrial protein homolog [Contarinia nasturtii]|uniref:COX assembly mitochondrial protein homolog n=1 Tax=Contarinia nasturtii TaxID=265458 RepID=UPI0012D40834|nr:COX assembly mitochondrial protein homolog [Contarinia nasturtii]